MENFKQYERVVLEIQAQNAQQEMARKEEEKRMKKEEKEAKKLAPKKPTKTESNKTGYKKRAKR